MARKERLQPAQQHSGANPLFPALSRQPRLGLFLALAYGVVMLFIALKYHVVGDYGVETDFFWAYVPQAKQVLLGHFVIEDFRGPAYPLILALTSLLTKDLFRAGIVIAALSGSVVLFFSFELLKRIASTDIAFVAVLLTGLNATFIQYCYSAGTDMVFCTFVLGFFFFLLKDDALRWSNIILSALFAACAYLTRYNGVFALFAVPLIFWFINPYRLPGRARVQTIAIFFAAFFLLIAPWGIYCLRERGSFFYNRNYLNIAYEMFAKGRISWDQYWISEAQKFGSLRQVIFSDPGRFVATVGSNLFEHLFSDLTLLVHWAEGIFVVAGMFVLGKRGGSSRQWAFIVGGACFFLVLLLVFYGERLSMALLPLYGMLAATGFAWPQLSARKLFGPVNAGNLAAVAVAAVVFTNGYQFNSANIDSGPKEIPVIADWFKSHEPAPDPETIIITRKPHIAYYLGMRMTIFPLVNTLDELHAEATKDSASYLFFSSVEAGMRPQFQGLLDPRTAPPWLIPVAYTVSPPAVLYRIKTSSMP
ncbi:MAG TPA: glycosyltransferase family 39 protein [Bacteroidota bacterium]|nr:glycosyltransferase family 39 protein [Bacteroidota bacterium]